MFKEKLINSLQEAIDAAYVSEDIADLSQLDKYGWRELSEAPLSIEFIKQNSTKIHYDRLFYNNTYNLKDIEEIEENIDKDGWRVISSWENLSPEFIKKYKDKLQLHEVMISNELPSDILKESLKKNKITLYDILDYLTLTPNVVEEIKDHFEFSWYNLISYYPEKLSTDVISEFKNEIPWRVCFKYVELPESFIEENLDYIGGNWDNVSQYQKLSKDFIIKHSDKIILNSLKENTKINYEELEKEGVITMLMLDR